MNTDARISVGLPSHPKTKKLIRRGGAEAAWSLVCLLLWTSQNKPDGDLSGMSDEDIEIAACWDGEEGALVRMLVEVRFLDGACEAYAIHDWSEHNPWAAGYAKRAESSKFAALCKRYGREKAAEMVRVESEDGATRMRPACDPHAQRTRTAHEPDAASSIPECPVTDTDTDTVTDTVSDTVSDTDTVSKKPLSASPPAVVSVFDHWRSVMGHPQAKLDAKREKAIKSALKIGYDAATLCLAIDGCKRSPFHAGQNDRAMVYDDLGLILRSADHIDKFVRLAQQPDLTGVSATTRQSIGAVQSWLDDEAAKDEQEARDEPV